jgi:CARDB
VVDGASDTQSDAEAKRPTYKEAVPVQPLGRRAVGFAVGFGLGLLVLNPLAARATDRPDLVVSTLGDPPATARAGDSFALTSTITNQGLAAAEKPTNTKFYLVVGSTRVKNLKGVQAIAPLGPGESDGATVALSVYSDTDVGTYTLQTCADGDSDVSEAVESNNCKTTSAVVGGPIPPAPAASLARRERGWFPNNACQRLDACLQDRLGDPAGALVAALR